jgi:hypothetical protein
MQQHGGRNRAIARRLAVKAAAVQEAVPQPESVSGSAGEEAETPAATAADRLQN